MSRISDVVLFFFFSFAEVGGGRKRHEAIDGPSSEQPQHQDSPALRSNGYLHVKRCPPRSPRRRGKWFGRCLEWYHVLTAASANTEFRRHNSNAINSSIAMSPNGHYSSTFTDWV